MSKPKDYLERIGIHPVSALDSELMNILGPKEGFEAVTVLEGLFDKSEERVAANNGHDPQVLRQRDIVDYVNGDLRITKAFSSFYDYFFLKKVMRLIEHCQPYIGEKILDVGSGNGIISGYVATICESSDIVGLEVSDNARNRAAEICGDLGLKNISFTEATDTIFDTIIAVRTIHENMIVVPEKKAKKTGKNILRERYTKAAEPFASWLSSHLKPNGHMLCVERNIGDPHHEGFLKALSMKKIQPIDTAIPQTLVEFTCREGDEIGSFFSTVLMKAV